VLRNFIKTLRQDAPESQLLADARKRLHENALLMQRAETQLQIQESVIAQYKTLCENYHRDVTTAIESWTAEIKRLQEQDEAAVWRLAAYQRWCEAKGIVPADEDLVRIMGGKC